MNHTMYVKDKYGDGVELHKCRACNFEVFVRPGHTQIVKIGDPTVSHGMGFIPVDDLRLSMRFGDESEQA